MNGSLIELPYLKDVTVFLTRTPKGYYTSNTFESSYKGVRVRNNTIISIDVFKSMSTFFSSDTLEKSRDILFFIFSGQGVDSGKTVIENFLQDLYLRDPIFRYRAGYVYYWVATEIENSTFYDILLNEFYEAFIVQLNTITRTVPHNKVVGIVNGKLYMSIKAGTSIEQFKKMYSIEVISKC